MPPTVFLLRAVESNVSKSASIGYANTEKFVDKIQCSERFSTDVKLFGFPQKHSFKFYQTLPTSDVSSRYLEKRLSDFNVVNSFAFSPQVRLSGFRNREIFFLVQYGILGFRIRNSSLGIQNPANDCNPESKFH